MLYFSVKLSVGADGTIELLIDNVKPADCGAYKVVISNSSGSASMVCAVAVKPEPRAPIFVVPIKDVTVTVGEPLKITGQILAFPLPELQWYKDGVLLRSSQIVNMIVQPDGIIGIRCVLTKLL